MQPIRDISTVQRITQELSRQTDERGRRMFLLWVVGINMGMRIGDIVDLRVGDLRGKTEYTYTPHKQAGKRMAHSITIPVPAAVRKVVAARCAGKPDEAWLLESRKRRPTRRQDTDKPKRESWNVGSITRQTARLDVKEIGRRCGISQRIGCHTMRKTFGYHYYQKTHDLAILQEWFYHESPATTLIYIGVTLDNFKKMVDKSPFGNLDGVEL